MLEVKNLTFRVNENGIERNIVHDISFKVVNGEMLVITGPNGGGKSTLAKQLSEHYNIPLLYLDNTKFYDNWVERTDEEQTKLVEDFLNKEQTK